MQSPSKISLENARGQRADHRLELDSASAAEMREFLAEMNELHPQQVMGVGTTGGLVRGMVLATLATVALMAALTVGPYYWAAAASSKDKAPATATADDKADKPAPAVAAQPAAEQPAGEKTPAAAPEPSQPVVSKATLERFGVDEVKQADPNLNPLDSKLDDLLDKAK